MREKRLERKQEGSGPSEAAGAGDSIKRPFCVKAVAVLRLPFPRPGRKLSQLLTDPWRFFPCALTWLRASGCGHARDGRLGLGPAAAQKSSRIPMLTDSPCYPWRIEAGANSTVLLDIIPNNAITTTTYRVCLCPPTKGISVIFDFKERVVDLGQVGSRGATPKGGSTATSASRRRGDPRGCSFACLGAGLGPRRPPSRAATRRSDARTVGWAASARFFAGSPTHARPRPHGLQYHARCLAHDTEPDRLALLPVEPEITG